MAEPLRAPKRKSAKVQPSGIWRQLGRAALRSAGRQPAMTAAMLVFGGLASMTVVNALALQSNRHPAPLFAEVSDPKARKAVVGEGTTRSAGGFQAPKAANGFQTDRVIASATGQDPSDPFIKDLQNELARRGLYTGAIDGKSGQKTSAAIRAYEQRIGLPVTGEPSPLILRKLATGTDAATQDTAAKDTVDTDPLRGVIQAASPPTTDEIGILRKVQQALNTLGFGPLTEDGKTGTATRDAIERFERSKKLPPTGIAAGKTLKALQRASGIALN
jgi:peptidoglycan hydrolase-like protein with peptidoglycan-binding domain